MTSHWFVEESDGNVAGPFSEKQISDDLLSDKIDRNLRVRQGEAGPWCPASRVRELFRRLVEQGWYVRSDDEKEFGPFTLERLLELLKRGQVATTAQVRQGANGPWHVAFDAMAKLGLLAGLPTAVGRSPASNPSQASRSQASPSQEQTDSELQASKVNGKEKWSVEPLRHSSMPIELVHPMAMAECQPFEKLLLFEPNRPEDGGRVSISRLDEDQPVGWLGQAHTERVMTNVKRGYSHVCLFNSQVMGPQVIVIVCPPGTTASACRGYIDQQFGARR